jgi:hypothetical protein
VLLLGLFIQTRLQNQKVGPSGERLYKGALDCFRQIISKEGTLPLPLSLRPFNDCAHRDLSLSLSPVGDRVQGTRGLYRGLGPNLVGVTPEKALKVHSRSCGVSMPHIELTRLAANSWQ